MNNANVNLQSWNIILLRPLIFSFTFTYIMWFYEKATKYEGIQTLMLSFKHLSKYLINFSLIC